MSVRFDRMWACIVLWMALDIVWGVIDPSLPTWAQIDSKASFHRDASTAFFIAYMWFAYREPTTVSSQIFQATDNKGDDAL